MEYYPYTAALVGAFLYILQQGLMMNTGAYRGKVGVGVGVGDDRHLERKSRRHGNLAENAAIFIVVLALTEMLIGTGPIVIAFGAVFALARVSHAFAFNSLSGSHEKTEGGQKYLLARMIGALLSGLTGIALSLFLIYSVITVVA
ncbi:MAG: MAPEG family protein [Erythrobacter sp.]